MDQKNKVQLGYTTLFKLSQRQKFQKQTISTIRDLMGSGLVIYENLNGRKRRGKHCQSQGEDKRKGRNILGEQLFLLTALFPNYTPPQVPSVTAITTISEEYVLILSFPHYNCFKSLQKENKIIKAFFLQQLIGKSWKQISSNREMDKYIVTLPYNGV